MMSHGLIFPFGGILFHYMWRIYSVSETLDFGKCHASYIILILCSSAFLRNFHFL